MSTATSASVPTTVGNSKLLLSYVRVAFFVMEASDASAYSTLGAAQKCERDDVSCSCQAGVVGAASRGKKVLAIYDPRFIFTPLSLRADGLPTQVTTELPGNEPTMGSEALDHR